MKIKTKLTIWFTILVAGILTISSLSVYLFSLAYRQEDFFTRLRHKAINTATLLLSIPNIDANLLRIIDENTIQSLRDVKVWILDDTKKILYSNTDSEATAKILPAFSYMRWTDSNFRTKDKQVYLCIVYTFKKNKYYVLATAEDYYGMAELRNLRLILIIVFSICMILTVFAALFNTRQSLKPIKDLIQQIDQIKASNLSSRLSVESKDEISDLAKTFNKMLERLEKAFETERMFVSNASHELRTPVTSIQGQLEVALIKDRSIDDYKKILSSVHDDIKNMATIINGFLELAEANTEPSAVKFEKVRIDELIFNIKDDFSKHNKHYNIAAEFDEIPEDEESITLNGNPRLLKIEISNLIDNACKFSKNKKVIIKIGFDKDNIKLKFIDEGIGIPSDELKYVFEPLYRTHNIGNISGSGIGLSIVYRIVTLHNGTINIFSEINKGTTVELILPKNIDSSINENQTDGIFKG